MARRAPQKIETTLFPFLSVLCSMIGVLMLFLVLILSSRIIATTAAAAGAGGAPSAPETELAQLQEELRLRRREHERLLASVRELEELIALQELQAAPAEPGGEPRRVRIVPDPAGAGTRKTARFLELTADLVRVHPGPVDHPAADLEDNASALWAWLREAHERRRREYLVVLLHPDGFEHFERLQRLLSLEEFKGLDWGYEPFSADWVLVTEY